MRDYLNELVRASPTPAHGRNVTREYLQARILGSLQRAGAMIPLAFHGGTALRFLFGSPRHSEGLDFSLERREAGYDLRAYLQAIRGELAAEGYAVDLRVIGHDPVATDGGKTGMGEEAGETATASEQTGLGYSESSGCIKGQPPLRGASARRCYLRGGS